MSRRPPQPEGVGRVRVGPAPSIRRRATVADHIRLRSMPPVVIDSAETEGGYAFQGVETVDAPLTSGDYSVRGFESRIAVERKSLTDLYGCAGAGRERFAAQWERLREVRERGGHAYIVIEAGWRELVRGPILAGERVGTIAPQAVIGTVIAWQARTGIPVWLADSWAGGQDLTLRLLRRAWLELSAEECEV